MKNFVFIILFGLILTGVSYAQVPEPEYVDLSDDAQNTESQIDEVIVTEPEENKYKGKILSVEEVFCEPEMESAEKECIKAKVKLLEGESAGKEIEITLDTRSDILAKEWDLEEGTQVVVTEFVFGTDSQYQITELYRSSSLIWFILIYIALVLVVGRWQGVGSLVGLALSALVIVKVTIPMTLEGYDPVSVALFGGFLVLVPSLYLSHGFNTKTSIALVGTTLGLLLTGLLAAIAINSVNLTGYGAEEALYIVSGNDTEFNIQSILLASMIIGGIGLIDDVTVAQVAVIREIYEENKSISVGKLYGKAMNVGKDHIASMVNTLFLAYAASSLPLLMLLVNEGAGVGDIANLETFAEEIVRTLVASSGLVITLPVTTLLAAWIYVKKFES